MSDAIHVGDIGTNIILNAGIDLSNKTALQIKYIAPNSSGAWDAVVYNNTFAKYTVQADDIDEAGTWKLFIYVELPSWSGHGNATEMKVLALGE